MVDRELKTVTMVPLESLRRQLNKKKRACTCGEVILMVERSEIADRLEEVILRENKEKTISKTGITSKLYHLEVVYAQE